MVERLPRRLKLSLLTLDALDHTRIIRPSTAQSNSNIAHIYAISTIRKGKVQGGTAKNAAILTSQEIPRKDQP